MFYSKGMSHLGVPLANNKGEGDDDDYYGNSTPFPPSSLHPTSMHNTTQGGTNMNSKEKPWRWGKRKEERNPNRFLERNDEDRRRRALVSLLSFVSTAKRGGGAGRGRRL